MGGLVIELARGKGKKDEPDGDEEGGEAEDTGTAKEAFEAAADAAFQAVKDDDKEAFRAAFRDAVDACNMGYEE